MYSSNMFIKGAQASIVYPCSKTGVPITRNGIVENVKATCVVLKLVCPNTQADIYRSLDYKKIVKVN